MQLAMVWPPVTSHTTALTIMTARQSSQEAMHTLIMAENRDPKNGANNSTLATLSIPYKAKPIQLKMTTNWITEQVLRCTGGCLQAYTPPHLSHSTQLIVRFAIVMSQLGESMTRKTHQLLKLHQCVQQNVSQCYELIMRIINKYVR